MDDLVVSAKGQKTLEGLYYSTSDLMQPTTLERVLERSENKIVEEEIDSKFHPQNWYASRYSDGTWPVLYAAEKEETALKEVLHHLRLFYKEELREKDVILDRRVVRLNAASSKAIDLIADKSLDHVSLSSPGITGYPYCQKLAGECREFGAEMLRAPSARDEGGKCVPIFRKKAVKKDEGHLKYLKMILSKEGFRLFEERPATRS